MTNSTNGSSTRFDGISTSACSGVELPRSFTLYSSCFACVVGVLVNLGIVTEHFVSVIMYHSVIVLLGLACICGATSFKEEDDVLVLTKDTFDSALAEFPDILVEFCTFKFCSHSHSLLLYCFNENLDMK